MQTTVDAVRRPLLAGVLVMLALLCAAGNASADGGAIAPPAAEEKKDTSVVVVKRGDRGDAVRKVQAALGVAADGVFGAQTERAVKRFQTRKGITADGIVGPQTRDALGLEPFARGSVRRKATGVRLPRMLRLIAECESGGNPRAVSPGGQYRGKYQFSVDTWRNLGGKGDPAAAPEAEQDRIALKLYERAGTAPWPSCP
ncbi:MAG: resuscitation-promoting factor RpfB [Thermoleophilaceae bacterium]|nr:resuscitation-promoting factor RpfB [Thermoleophilaceae bacterium]